jgi:hypothetical protein
LGLKEGRPVTKRPQGLEKRTPVPSPACGARFHLRALRGSAVGDDAAKSVQGNGEKDTSNSGRRNDHRPDNGSISPAIEHSLRENHKMRVGLMTNMRYFNHTDMLSKI